MITWAGQKARPSTEGQNMHYLVLKSCFAAGARRSSGDVVQLGPDEAAALLSMGRVEETAAPAPKKDLPNRAVKPKTTRKAKSNED